MKPLKTQWILFPFIISGFFLTACNTIDSYFGGDDDANLYSRPTATRVNTPLETKNVNSGTYEQMQNDKAVAKGEVTKRIEPGTSNVEPKATPTKNVTQQGPTVPNMAPSVSQ